MKPINIKQPSNTEQPFKFLDISMEQFQKAKLWYKPNLRPTSTRHENHKIKD